MMLLISAAPGRWKMHEAAITGRRQQADQEQRHEVGNSASD
jgi:hypothetical protein